jgi:hypothetical protein
MDLSALRVHLDEVFDNELLFHGFTNYMRDYELITYQSVDPHSGLSPRHLRLLFRFVRKRRFVPPSGRMFGRSDSTTSYFDFTP